MSRKFLRTAFLHSERYMPAPSTPFNKLDGAFASNYFFAKKYARDKCILDVGCGCGYGTVFLAHEARYAVGVDIYGLALMNGLNRANYHHRSNIDFVRADAKKLPFRNHVFDLVISFEVIEHLDKTSEFLKGISELLKKPLGMFVLSTPNANFAFPHPFHIHEFTPPELFSNLQKFFAKIELYGKTISKKEFILAENKLRTRLRFKISLALYRSALRHILYLFYLFPREIQLRLLGTSRLTTTAISDYRFRRNDVDNSGTTVAVSFKCAK